MHFPLVQYAPAPQLLGAQVPPQPSLPQTFPTQLGVHIFPQSAGQQAKFSPIEGEQIPSPHFRGTTWTELSQVQQAVPLHTLELFIALHVSTGTQAFFATQYAPVQLQWTESQVF